MQSRLQQDWTGVCGRRQSSIKTEEHIELYDSTIDSEYGILFLNFGLFISGYLFVASSIVLLLYDTAAIAIYSM